LLPVLLSPFFLGCQPYPVIPEDVVQKPGRGSTSTAPLPLQGVAASAPQKGEYTIGKRDILFVEVMGQRDLTSEQEVDSQGEIILPLIGNVPAAGRTPDELAGEIEAKLRAGYLLNPKVRVSVRQYRSQRVFVMGEVRSPGTYYLKGPMTLLEVILEAGGLTAQAGSSVKVIRPKDPLKREGPVRMDEASPDEVIKVDLSAIRAGDTSQNLILHNGDTIFVQKLEPRYFYVLGEVRNPGQYEYKDGITVIQAITIAGGITKKGSIKRTKIIRTVKGIRKKLPATMSSTVEPNDIILVPQRFF
jgi:polysaccharide export outer membrane protein